MSIFLTETSTRHSLLYKHKHFRDTTQTKLTSNSTKLTGASKDAPIDVDDQSHREEAAAGSAAPDTPPVALLREESDDDDVIALHDLPTLDQAETATEPIPRVAKRRRGGGEATPDEDDVAHDTADVPGSDEFESHHSEDDDGDGLFVDQDSDEAGDTARPPAKRRKDDASAAEDEGGRDEKKKMAMDISYEGFSIYGRVLCLVVKRREGGGGGGNKGKGVAGRAKTGQSAPPGGQAMMENWITSTQIPDAAAAATNGSLDAS